MNRQLQTVRPAAEELADAVGWYEDRRAGLGSEFFDAVVRTLNRIAETPEAGSPFSDLEARRMLVAGFPYQVVYRIEPDDIRVIAFAHLKRRPGFWRDRR